MNLHMYCILNNSNDTLHVHICYFICNFICIYSMGKLCRRCIIIICKLCIAEEEFFYIILSQIKLIWPNNAETNLLYVYWDARKTEKRITLVRLDIVRGILEEEKYHPPPPPDKTKEVRGEEKNWEKVPQ